METTSRLKQRVADLEARTGPLEDPSLSGEFWELTARLSQMADRYRGTPAPPVALQSAAERIVRAGLAAADGHEGQAYARRFWATVAEGLRAYEQERAA